MAGFKIVWATQSRPVTYLYENASAALRKVRVLQKAHANFTISDADAGDPITLEQLVELAEAAR